MHCFFHSFPILKNTEMATKALSSLYVRKMVTFYFCTEIPLRFEGLNLYDYFSDIGIFHKTFWFEIFSRSKSNTDSSTACYKKYSKPQKVCQGTSLRRHVSFLNWAHMNAPHLNRTLVSLKTLGTKLPTTIHPPF